MSFESLQERLTALQETTGQLKELIERLGGIKFQPGSVAPGTEDDSTVASELSAEIGQIIREEEDDLELLQEEIEDLRPGRPGSEEGHDRTRLKEGAARLMRELQSHRVNFRSAQLTAKRNLAQARRLERELLLQSFSQPVSEAATPTDSSSQQPQPPPPQNQHQQGQQQAQLATRQRQTYRRLQGEQSALSTEDQQTVAATNDVTNALRSMHDMIATELTKSEFAQQTLEESTAVMKQLGESYGSLGGMVATSVDLVGTLLRSQKSDTWYLRTAFYMLLVTLGWLVFRRLLYGPLWWFVWLPVRLVFGGSVKVGSAIVSSGSGSGASRDSGAVVSEGKIAVEGVSDEAVPTVDVGDGDRMTVGEDGSVVREVEDIIDGGDAGPTVGGHVDGETVGKDEL